MSVYATLETAPTLGWAHVRGVCWEREERRRRDCVRSFNCSLLYWYDMEILFGLEIPRKCITYCGHECMHCCGL